MENNYIYEEENAEEGITFKKIGRFIKKGWLLIIICMAAALVLATCVALPIKKFYQSELVGKTSIEYLYKGVDEGLDPNGGTLNPDTVINTSVLRTAVSAAGLEGVLTDISSLRSTMRVEAVISKEYSSLVKAAADGDSAAREKLDAMTYFPTRYDIIISEPQDLGLTDSQTKLLIEEIIDAYFSQFRTTYSKSQQFSADVFGLSDDSTWEFTRVYDVYLNSITSVKKKLDSMTREADTFTSTESGATFAQLERELSGLTLGYANFNDFVLGKNVWRDKDIAYENLVATRKQLNDSIKAQEALSKGYSEQIAGMTPTTITVTGVGGVVTKTESHTDEYYSYQAKLTAVNENITDLKSQLTNTEIRIKTVTDGADPGPLPDDGTLPTVGTLTPTPAADITTASTMLAALEADSAKFITKVNKTISDYYNTVYVSSAVRQVAPASVVRTSAGFSLWVVLLIAALIGLIVGCVWTGVLIAKHNAAHSAPAPAATADEEKADN